MLKIPNFKPLSRGNSKLSKTIGCWSITPIKSCLNCEQCKKSCYALSPYRRWETVRQAWDKRFQLAKNNEHIGLINLQLKRTRKIKTVRIHVAGDFFSQDYVDSWIEIARANPLKKFYSYSKVFDLLDLSNIENLPNVNLINSIAEDGGINYGDENRVKELKDMGYRVCPVTEGKKVVCGKGCNLCIDTKKVCFYKH